MGGWVCPLAGWIEHYGPMIPWTTKARIAGAIIFVVSLFRLIDMY